MYLKIYKFKINEQEVRSRKKMWLETIKEDMIKEEI